MGVAYRRSEACSGPTADGLIARPAERATASATWATVRRPVRMCSANPGAPSRWRCSPRCPAAQLPRLTSVPRLRLPSRRRTVAGSASKAKWHHEAILPQGADDLPDTLTPLLTPGIDLWDLDAVWAKRNLILGRLRAEGPQTMPGAQVGGPWPAEWISLFERWAATGSDAEPGHHLLLVKPDGPYQVRTLTGDLRPLTATATAPTDGCRGWFGLDSVSTGQRDYTLHLA